MVLQKLPDAYGWQLDALGVVGTTTTTTIARAALMIKKRRGGWLQWQSNTMFLILILEHITLYYITLLLAPHLLILGPGLGIWKVWTPRRAERRIIKEEQQEEGEWITTNQKQQQQPNTHSTKYNTMNKCFRTKYYEERVEREKKSRAQRTRKRSTKKKRKLCAQNHKIFFLKSFCILLLA